MTRNDVSLGHFSSCWSGHRLESFYNLKYSFVYAVSQQTFLSPCDMPSSVDLFGLQVAFYDSVKYVYSHMIYSGDNNLKYILLNIPTVVYLSEEHRL